MLQVTELEGHAGRVTSVVVVPVAAPASKVVNYCWTSSLDNTICYWDFAAAELLKKVNVELPVYHMVSRMHALLLLLGSVPVSIELIFLLRLSDILFTFYVGNSSNIITSWKQRTGI